MCGCCLLIRVYFFFGFWVSSRAFLTSRFIAKRYIHPKMKDNREREKRIKLHKKKNKVIDEAVGMVQNKMKLIKRARLFVVI